MQSRAMLLTSCNVVDCGIDHAAKITIAKRDKRPTAK